MGLDPSRKYLKSDAEMSPARITECVVQPKISREGPLEDLTEGFDLGEMEQIIFRMREKESNVYHTNCKERRDIANDELVSLWRQMLVDWMFFVVDCCDLQRHSVAAATYFLDIAILRGLCKTREEHQLAAATSLQMALKTFDTAVIKLDKLVKLGRGGFTENDVAIMEMEIIKSLDWNLHPPTVYCYVRQFGRMIPRGTRNSTKEVIDDMAKLIAEELVLDERYIRYNPSVQGYSCVLVALYFIPDYDFPQDLREIFFMRLTKTMNLDNNSPLISKVMRKIYKSLKHKDKLQKIIDISMAKTNRIELLEEDLGNDEEKEKNSKKLGRGSKVAQEHHSPRDVKQKLRITL